MHCMISKTTCLYRKQINRPLRLINLLIFAFFFFFFFFFFLLLFNLANFHIVLFASTRAYWSVPVPGLPIKLGVVIFFNGRGFYLMVPIRHHSLCTWTNDITSSNRSPPLTVHRNMSCDLFYHFGEYKGHLPLSTSWKLTKSQGINEDKKKIATLLNVTNEGDIIPGIDYIGQTKIVFPKVQMNSSDKI